MLSCCDAVMLCHTHVVRLRREAVCSEWNECMLVHEFTHMWVVIWPCFDAMNVSVS